MKTSKPIEPPLTDLRSITRQSSICSTTVTVEMGFELKTKWLLLGQVNIRSGGGRSEGVHRLEARMSDGITDWEEDSAYALVLPLIGLQLGTLVVSYHYVHFTAWIDPNQGDPSFTEFRVPSPGYDVTKLPGFSRCKQTRCEPKGHGIVPEGYYQPPFNADLYKLVAGKRVEIAIGPVYKEDE